MPSPTTSVQWPQRPASDKTSAVQVPSILNERQEFLLFIKILFLLFLDDNSGMLRMRAKQIIAKCTRRNRMGQSEYVDLQYAVASRLRFLVGEAKWEQAKDYLDEYCQRRGIQHASYSVV
jgi:hypothetical protein